MSKKRRNHSPEFKAKVALAAAKGDKTLSELAKQFDLHPNQITNWKKDLIKNASTLFEGSSERTKNQSEDIEKLQAKIGQLTMENDFLAKVLGP